MILIKWKQVNREVPSSNPADFIYQFSIFHVISYVTKKLNSYITLHLLAVSSSPPVLIHLLFLLLVILLP